MDDYHVILKPVRTEKSLKDQENNRYLFWVDPKATKNQIKRAFKKLFGIEPLAVRTMLLKGQTKLLRSQNRLVRAPKRKKAIIQLREKEKIPLVVSKSK